MFSDYTIAKMNQYGIPTNSRKLSFFQQKLNSFQPRAWQTIVFHSEVPSPEVSGEQWYQMDFTDTQRGIANRFYGISEVDCKAKLVIFLYEEGHITL